MMNANGSNARAVAYLDLLGFSVAARRDPASAIRLLQDYSDSLHMKLRDARGRDEDESATGEIARLNHLMSVSSFETFLPMSDSVFIVSSFPSDLVLQLSHFLWDCLQFRWHAFANPENPSSPTSVTTRIIDLAANRTIESAEAWLPVLFRGGISWGQATTVKAFGLKDGEECVGHNVIGEAVVSAVGLEALKLKGPRVLLSDGFLQKVTSESARQYILETPDLPGTSELLWPIAAMETANGLEDALNNDLGELIRGALNLLVFHIADMSVVPHYHALLALIVRAAIRRFDEEQRIRQWVCDLVRAASQTRTVADAIVAQAFGGTV